MYHGIMDIIQSTQKELTTGFIIQSKQLNFLKISFILKLNDKK